ncbi:unnamed protein product [Candidula unifasciata]|uniref:Uncharacterized protein n=1 Tax=Candidula unifasciata TaxID=100452 RepID=A0A8S3ZBY0_9EUPU|nr:unnamed protein product [Candidula unifasciata]
MKRFVSLSKDCCVRTVLISVVVTTAIVLIVIVVSHWKTNVKSTRTKQAQTVCSRVDVCFVNYCGTIVKPALPFCRFVNDSRTTVHKQLIFEHQFLLRDFSNRHSVQILAIDDFTRKYVILWPDINKHYNLYLVVDFEKNTETVLIVSKSENEFATNVKENTALLCQTKRFDRDFHGEPATVADVVATSNQKKKSGHSNIERAVSYIGGPLALERFISTVVNSSCEDLPTTALFKWDKLGLPFPGIPLSKGQICQKFRTCNYIQKSCDPYYRENPGRTQNQPYCNCRDTAAKDADGISCPRVADDGGECEIPRRDLLVTQRSLPCLCIYRFPVVYPYTSVRTADSLTENTVKDGNILKWYEKEKVVTGPALTCSQCPC